MRHLSNINICLNQEEKQHLLITGKNGSGKTTLLCAIQKCLKAINEGHFSDIERRYEPWVSESMKKVEKATTVREKYEAESGYKANLQLLERYQAGIKLAFHGSEDLDAMYQNGEFITAFYSANRQTNIERVNGVSDVKLQEHYGVYDKPGNILLRYMVHLKTQQAYARNEGDMPTVEKIQEWFARFERALKVLLDNDSITLEYDFKEYDFKLYEPGRAGVRFDELSDRYSSLIDIVSDLILRMDRNWLLKKDLSNYDAEGVVLIDELETHLHIELQKKILPFLTTFFPNIQFIVTTHSPYILSSIANAKCFDLENRVELENLSSYSSEDIAEGYFNVDEFSEVLKSKAKRYDELANLKEPSEEERAERARLRMELKNSMLSIVYDVTEMVDEIEGSKKNNG